MAAGAYKSMTDPILTRLPVVSLTRKICLLGDSGVGKSSLVRRFVHDRFDDPYASAIGIKVSRRTLVIDTPHRLVNLHIMLWDLADSAEFDLMRSTYLRDAAGGLLVCDLTRSESLNHLHRYADDLRTVNPHAAMVIAATKYDVLPSNPRFVEKIHATAARYQSRCFYTSARSGYEVENAFRSLGRQLLAQMPATELS